MSNLVSEIINANVAYRREHGHNVDAIYVSNADFDELAVWMQHNGFRIQPRGRCLSLFGITVLSRD